MLVPVMFVEVVSLTFDDHIVVALRNGAVLLAYDSLDLIVLFV